MGGVIFDIKGNIIHTYAWGLGIKTNNSAESLSMFQGMTLLQKLGVSKEMEIGDFNIMINYMKSDKESIDITLIQCITKAHLLGK